MLAFGVAALYLTTVFGYLLQLIFRRPTLGRWSTGLFLAGWMIHLVSLVHAVVTYGVVGLFGQSQLYSSAAAGVGLVFLILRTRLGVEGAGAFFAPTTLLLYLISVGGSPSVTRIALGGPWTLIHITLMSLAFGVFVASFFVGGLFLIQEGRLKSHRALLARLPPLERMDQIHYQGLTVGFVLLSLAILVGALLSKQTRGLFFTGDPRQVAALVAWGIYALFLNVRIRAGWRGRRGILLSLVGFASVILAFIGLRHGGG